jgi:hypothetical protein
MARWISEIILDEIEKNGSLGLRDGFLRDLATRRALPFNDVKRYADALLELRGKLLSDTDAARIHGLAEQIRAGR